MNLGVIGRNFVVDSMMQAVSLTPGVNIKAIYSRTKEGADIFGEKYGVSRRYTDLCGLAADDEVDAVYIASPNYAHYGQAKLMLSAGKHVFLEKPFTPTLAEARELFDLARRQGVVLLEAMMPAHSPALEEIRELLPRLGVLRQAHFSFCQYSSRYDKFRAGIVENAFRPELCNGALMDLGVYCAEMLVMLFGMPKVVSADSVFLSTGVDGETTALLRYPETTAVLSASKITQATLPSFVAGENGTLEIDWMSHPEKFTLKLRGCDPEIVDAAPALPTMCYELADFLRCIEDRSLADRFERYTLDTVALLEEIRKSAGINFSGEAPRPISDEVLS
ncbi:MAG: Gfo/Idh/MocA family oxidoreductase [Clostridia bacterium]|nr:Gfo/Idh/MocA family oxidoreductase [Clostridia bacterium]